MFLLIVEKADTPRHDSDVVEAARMMADVILMVTGCDERRQKQEVKIEAVELSRAEQ